MLLSFSSCGCSHKNGVDRDSFSSGDSIAMPVKTIYDEPVYYNDETTDKAKIESVLKSASQLNDRGQRIVAIAKEFIGVPYVGWTLEIPGEEILYVNTSGLDCLTFVETVLALAYASEIENSRVDDYLINLRNLRYRDGEIKGYASRLHYSSEWIMDNEKRGNMKDVAPLIQGSELMVKTLDFMSNHREIYPAMANDSIFEEIKKNEEALKNLHFYIIPTEKVAAEGKQFLQDGDIVGIVTDRDGLDVSHVGIVEIKDGVPHMIHASSKYKKVVDDITPLYDYLKQQKSKGIRVYRSAR